jgi:hypothetical protein
MTVPPMMTSVSPGLISGFSAGIWATAFSCVNPSETKIVAIESEVAARFRFE